MVGWIVTAIIALVIAGVVGIIAITTSNARQLAEQKTRQAQATQLATALTNQAQFNPAPGRKVSINASIFPDGGGVIRADSDEKEAPPVIQTITPPVHTLVVTVPGTVHVVPVGPPQPPAAHPGQAAAAAGSQPAPAQDPEVVAAFDPNAAAAAGAAS